MRWYEIRAKAEVSEIWLYDEIGLWGVGAKEFIAELNAVASPKIDLHVNSPGGDVFDAAAIYNAIRRHPAEVTSYVDGLAASAASLVALAGARVVMAANALYMIHNPWGGTFGTAEDMRKTADVLDKVRDTMVGAYVAKTGKTEEEIKAYLDAETWFDAEEARDAGFADDIADEMDLAACARFAPVLAKYGAHRTPRALTGKRDLPPADELERVLRQVCSLQDAKAILAQGYPGRPRDVDPPELPAEPSGRPRDVDPPRAARDRVADLLTRAERVAPSFH